ncbi:MAG: pantoate--beta-alanine ligase [Planctomycetota bacterium]
MQPFHGGVFVPTMGALHDGHAALIRRAAGLAGGRAVVVSVFVNRAQFNEPSDFETYPRELEHDVALCADAGATCVFAPPEQVVYPPDAGPSSPPLPAVATAPGLEDRFRPGHFAGVWRVCARLFDLVQPVQAIFGEKDWQQLQLMRALAARRGGPSIIAGPTVRDADGVALSSRNAHLTREQRSSARALPASLEEAGRINDPAAAEHAGRAVLAQAGLDVEYFAVRDAAMLEHVRAGEPARVLAAARLGTTRLIDNMPWPGGSGTG